MDALLDHAPLDDGYRLLGETHDPIRDGWTAPERTQLYRFHLHYADWLWPLWHADDRSGFARLWDHYRKGNAVGRGDAWSAYVVSLRAWNLCATFDRLVAGGTAEQQVVDDLRVMSGFLSNNAERDVGGNHLIKNLKALIGLSVFFDDDSLARWARELVDQLDVQVLADGGHFELSPSYHAQVLGDLMDVRHLLSAAKSTGLDELDEAIAAMRSWLATFVRPDGTLPLVGDTTPPRPGWAGAIGVTAPVDHGQARLLNESGYVVAWPRPGVHVVIDLGQPCPRELPAHAQADWGTFVVWGDGEEWVVDPGVSTYVGQRRAWERSTEAHNTVWLGHDQTEVWGSFRAGRRAEPSPISFILDRDAVRVAGSLVDQAGRRQERTFTISDLTLVVSDTIEGAAISALHVSEAATRRVRPTSAPSADRDTVEIGIGFGERQPVVRLRQHFSGTAGWQIDLATEDAR